MAPGNGPACLLLESGAGSRQPPPAFPELSSPPLRVEFFAHTPQQTATFFGNSIPPLNIKRRMGLPPAAGRLDSPAQPLRMGCCLLAPAMSAAETVRLGMSCLPLVWTKQRHGADTETIRPAEPSPAQSMK